MQYQEQFNIKKMFMITVVYYVHRPHSATTTDDLRLRTDSRCAAPRGPRFRWWCLAWNSLPVAGK